MRWDVKKIKAQQGKTEKKKYGHSKVSALKNDGHSRVSVKKIKWHSRVNAKKNQRHSRVSVKKMRAQQGKCEENEGTAGRISAKRRAQQGKCEENEGHSRVSANKMKGTAG